LRGLALNRPEFERRLRADPRRAAAALPAADVPLLYWTAAAWRRADRPSKDQPDVLGELPVVEALMDGRSSSTSPSSAGAIHSFMIGYEFGAPGPGRRSGAALAPPLRADAMQLSGGTDAHRCIALAEAVCVPQQPARRIRGAAQQACVIDTDRAGENRLCQPGGASARARWLLLAHRSSVHPT